MAGRPRRKEPRACRASLPFRQRRRAEACAGDRELVGVDGREDRVPQVRKDTLERAGRGYGGHRDWQPVVVEVRRRDQSPTQLIMTVTKPRLLSQATRMLIGLATLTQGCLVAGSMFERSASQEAAARIAYA